MGPALIGATPAQQTPAQHSAERPAATRLTRVAPRTEILEHTAARTSADQRRVLGYWTPQRMAGALPIDLLGTVTKDGGLLSGLTNQSGLAAAPGLTGGAAKVATPRRQSARPQASTSGSRWATGGAVARTTGRVFLTIGGVDFVCSAGTVKSANRDVVVTAGHCVKDGTGAWADNWTFVPGYEAGGGKPFGSYTARRMFVAGPWSREANDSYDVGMVALNPSASGRHVSDVVGAQNIAFNASRGTQTYGFGFPADPPYDGEQLVYCSGRVKQDPYGQTRDQGLGCDMTAGSSGGPWLSGFDPATGQGAVTSVSSFKYSDDQRTMWGPYFGDSVKALFSTAERA